MNIVFLDEYSLGGIDLSRIKQLGNYTGYEKTTPGEIAERCIDADIVITNKVPLRAEAIKVLPQLKLICIAATGMNNVDLEAAAERGIEVRNAVGYSTHAVTETTIGAAIALLRQSIYYDRYVKSGEYAASDAPFHFGRPLHQLYGKRWGIIGLGAIGALVANAAIDLGMNVLGYDPYVSAEAAWRLSPSVEHVTNLDDVLHRSDYVTIHVPAMDSTRGMIGAHELEVAKPGCAVMNFSRDTLVDNAAMAEALEAGRVATYVTDFATPEVMAMQNTIVLPHLGASTAEAEDNCAIMATLQMKDYLENGNIKNSVNSPACDMGPAPAQGGRVAVLHANVPDMLSQITGVFGEVGANIDNLTNKARGNAAYTMLDLNAPATDELVAKLTAIEGVHRVRIVK